MNLKRLVGSGDRIALSTLPFLVVAVVADLVFPSLFDVGDPPTIWRTVWFVVLIVGIAIWLWSVVLILVKVPRGELITTGPFAMMKHPLYTSVSLLVLPSVGFLLDTWLGAVIGVVMYVAARRYAPDEEAALARTFGTAWDDYRDTVKIPWL